MKRFFEARIEARALGLLAVVGFLGFAPEARAAWTYPGCDTLSDNLTGSFTVTPLVSRARFPASPANDTLARPIKMAFDTSGGKLDIYFTEKFGKIKHYRGNFNGTDSSIRVVGSIPVNREFQEDGLWSIALDPKFKTNRHLYVMYAHAPGATNSSPLDGSATVGWRLSRFTLNAGTNTLNNASEKILLHVPAGVGNRWHTGGSLRFDHFGNLYVSLGDNESLMMGPGNTADLRGGILRIRPDSAGGYTIPAGNFGEYWANLLQGQGRTTLAAQYRDTSKVRPEIYVKGTRNAYSIGIDPYREGHLAWPECGPDGFGNTTEEHNITRKPAFSGWPFWAGYTARITSKPNNYEGPAEPSTEQWTTYNPSAQTSANTLNRWPGTTPMPRKGVDTLPPVHRPFHAYAQACAQGGPIVRYDGRGTVPGKLPPHFDNTWFFSDYDEEHIWAVKLDTGGLPASTTPKAVFLPANYPRNAGAPSIGRPIDFQLGPDGALYLLNWGAPCCDGNGGGQTGATSIVRIAYSGPTCSAPGLFPTLIAGGLASRKAAFQWQAEGITVSGAGPHTVRIFDMGGRTVRLLRGEGPRQYSLTTLAPGRVYLVRIETREGTSVVPWTRL